MRKFPYRATFSSWAMCLVAVIFVYSPYKSGYAVSTQNAAIARSTKTSYSKQQQINPDSRAHRIQALLILSAQYCDQAKFVQAENEARCALKLAQSLLPNSQTPAKIECLLQLARVCDAAGKYKEGEKLARQAIAMRARDSENELAAVDNILLADLIRQQGRYRQAKPLLEKAVTALNGSKQEYAYAEARAVNNLGALHYWLGNDADAARLLERAVQMRQKLHGGSHPAVANSLADLAVVYIRQGKEDEGKRLLDRALAIRKRVHGLHPETATTLGNLGAYYLSLGNWKQAESFYKQACQIMERLPNHPDYAHYLVGLATICAHAGKYKQAVALCQKGLAIQSRVLSPDSPLIAKTLSTLGSINVDAGKLPEAATLLERALLIQQQAYGPSHPAIAQTLENLGDCYFLQHKITLAENLYRRALAIRQKLSSRDKLPLALLYNNLANCCLESGKVSNAAILYQKALALPKLDSYAATHKEKIQVINDNYQRCLLKLKPH